MTAEQRNYVAILLNGFFADRPKQSVSNWCVQNLQFDEPGNRGPFSLAGSEYLREPLDSWADLLITDQVQLFGSQSRKTGSIMGGASWTVRNEPSRLFWVMPTRDTARSFSRTRWTPMLRASPQMAELIPSGRKRHEFSTFQMRVGNSIVDLVWSNSPAALASIPARVVILDEVDKFNEGGKEANAVDLADQRVKSFASPKKIKTSTPTLVEGLIWQEYLKTDQRRRFVPCPHCQKFVVLVWSKSFTVFKATGLEAEIRWDKEAKRPDGTWDLDRVDRSARAECPHCGGHIRDGHKTMMDRNGEWRPTAKAAAGYRGWHLPSLYAASAQTNFGKLALKFLQARASMFGLQGFINGDLAEPYESQDTQGRRIEIITDKVVKTDGKAKILSVDVQSESPYFWQAVLLIGGGEVHVADAGSLDTWDEVRAKQEEHEIRDEGVAIDSGDKTKRSSDSVYVNCAEHCVAVPQRDALPRLLGWTPCKGMPVAKRWRNEKGVMVPYRIQPRDPYEGTSMAGAYEIGLFEFAGEYFKDVFDGMRRGKGNVVASFEESIANEEFWRHLDSNHKATFFNKRTKRPEYGWVKKSKTWPDHMLDCIVQGLAYATYLGILKPE